MPPTPHRRSVFTAPVVTLALALVLVLAVGAWLRWRPISDTELARLNARAIVENVQSQVQGGAINLPRELLDQQLLELGPSPTRWQQQRFQQVQTERDLPTPTGNVRSADDAALLLSQQALTSPDSHLSAQLAEAAGSWWREAPPAEQAKAWRRASSSPDKKITQDISAPEENACTPGSLSAVTALDRLRYTAQAAAPWSTHDSSQKSARPGRTTPHTPGISIEEVESASASVLDSPPLRAVLRCEPTPIKAIHPLPRGITSEPTETVRSAAHDANVAAVAALNESPQDQREWLLHIVRLTALTQSGSA